MRTLALVMLLLPATLAAQRAEPVAARRAVTTDSTRPALALRPALAPQPSRALRVIEGTLVAAIDAQGARRTASWTEERPSLGGAMLLGALTGLAPAKLELRPCVDRRALDMTRRESAAVACGP